MRYKCSMDVAAARQFAQVWERDWNAHDLEALLAHYADDVVFSSPVARQVLPDGNGVLRGKDELRRYWSEGLRRIPDLRFEVVAVYVGVETLMINYRNQSGNLVAEVLTFDGDRIVAGSGTYLDDDNAAGVRAVPE
jgi:ketosteroid isomerase-like protein